MHKYAAAEAIAEHLDAIIARQFGTNGTRRLRSHFVECFITTNDLFCVRSTLTRVHVRRMTPGRDDETVRMPLYNVASPASEVPNDCCSICLNERKRRCKSSWCTLDACGHNFHRKCMRSWLEREGLKATCPVCRATLLPEEQLESGDDEPAQ